MTDLQAKLERFETLAAECNLIGGYLATDPIKRELYLRLAKNYRQLDDRFHETCIMEPMD